jgi:hypothetical protein
LRALMPLWALYWRQTCHAREFTFYFSFSLCTKMSCHEMV